MRINLGRKCKQPKAFATLVILLAAMPSVAANNSHSGRAKPYYIAARATYVDTSASAKSVRYNSEIKLKGTSNLPAGSLLSIHVYDYVGYQSQSFSDEIVVTVGQDGYFETRLLARASMELRPNLLCGIAFLPDDPRQPKHVARLFGPRGAKLDIEHNPQVGRNRGGDYLELLVAAPR